MLCRWRLNDTERLDDVGSIAVVFGAPKPLRDNNMTIKFFM